MRGYELVGKGCMRVEGNRRRDMCVDMEIGTIDS